MNDKKQAENVVPSVDNTSMEKDLISSEDVLAVVSGDQVALAEQMERAKEAALAQKDNAQEIAAEKAKKKLEEEEKKKKAIMEEVKRRKAEAQKREQLACEEAERKKAAAEAERQRQLAEKKRIEEENKAKEEQAKLEAERKKQEKEAAIKAREDAKKAKEQARIDAKKARAEAKEAAKKAKMEARENAKKAREDAKKAKLEAKKAKEQARIDAKKAKEQAKKDAKNKKGTPVQAKATAPVPPVAPASQPKPVTSQPTPTSAVPASKTNDAVAKNNSKPVVANTKSTPNNDNKKESNLKYYMTFIFLALLIWMVAFLPEISSFVSNYFANKNQETVPEITTGTLTCTMNTNDDKYDYYYEAEFNFTDSKMYRLTFSATTKGDQHLDAVELSAMESSCNLLQQQTANLNGIDVSCSLSNGVYENIQKLDYEDLNEDEVTTAYLEAGGTYPNYKYGQNISEIEKEMKAGNYTCERHS